MPDKTATPETIRPIAPPTAIPRGAIDRPMHAQGSRLVKLQRAEQERLDRFGRFGHR